MWPRKNTILMTSDILISILRKKKLKITRKEIKARRFLVENHYVSFMFKKVDTRTTYKDHWIEYCLDHYAISAEKSAVQVYNKRF